MRRGGGGPDVWAMSEVYSRWLAGWLSVVVVAASVGLVGRQSQS